MHTYVQCIWNCLFEGQIKLKTRGYRRETFESWQNASIQGQWQNDRLRVSAHCPGLM